MNDEVRQNSPKAWLLAARPKTLTGAAVPVLIGGALAYVNAHGDVRWLPLVLCMLFALVMQIDANFVNDFFDYLKGNDGLERLGPKRACTEGWVTPRAMRWALVLTTGVACLIGLPLVLYGGWTMIAVGVACVLFCFLYTTTLSYVALGDVLVLVFFGLVPVTLTYYLSMPEGAQSITTECWVAAFACGLVIDTLLVVNNYRDIDNDRKAGKRTLIVLIGASEGKLLYFFLGVAACFLCDYFIACGHNWAGWLPTIGYLPFHVATALEMHRIGKGPQLNRVLGNTARNMLFFGVLVAVGFLVS